MRQKLLDGGVRDENTYYGFLSPKFKAKTGVDSTLVRGFVESAGGHVDVIAFSPLYDMQAFFQNTFEQAEYLHPGFLACAEALLSILMPGVKLRDLVMDSGSSFFCNYFIAKPSFWRRWLAINEAIFKIAEDKDSPLGQAMRRAEIWEPVEVQLKVFLMERTASLIIAADRNWKPLVCDPFRLPSSIIEPFASGYADAIVLDALKAGYLRFGFPEYLDQFNKRRAPYFRKKPAPFAPPGISAEAPIQTPTNTVTPQQLKEAIAAGNADTALAAASKLIDSGTLALPDLLEFTSFLTEKGRRADAIRSYQMWVQRTPPAQAFGARFNLAILLSDTGDVTGAEREYRASLDASPGFVQARLNLASVLERQGRPAEAIAEWLSAVDFLEKTPNANQELLLHALNNLGRFLEQERRFAEAEAWLTRSLKLKHDQPSVIWHWVHLRQKQCKWPVYEAIAGITKKELLKNSSALALLAGSEDPSVQFEAAKLYVKNNIPSDVPKLANPDGYGHSRLRIGYLSSNFGMHAVSLLTAELYELHDRQRVEVYGYCWSPEDGTPLRARVIGAMDHFRRIAGMTDEAAAQCIRDDEIDILVDLQGLTSGCRPKILARRPAPVQLTYLGFPGTTALPCVDYVLADRYVLPDKLRPYFSEEPLYLPNCFQVNDRQRIPGPLPTRAQCGLPDDAFVFCAFNNNYKFTPELFAVWMNILARTQGSVLWLLADNDTARENLTAAAKRHGIAPERIVFSPRVPLQDYWARYAAADLFLDTLPFNGGTTASDALWMGVPVLTCSGRTFASRMAGSLLQAIGLPELITTKLKDYEELAVRIAGNRAMADDLKRRLREARTTAPLFDTPRFVRDLEDIFERIARRG
ncbi:MAG: tetratricopeptide repeat protein [Ignavibacteria bacterium]